MKRFLCGLLAVCSLFTTALADIAQQLLWAEEVAQELDMASGVMGMFYPLTPEEAAVLDSDAAGEHASAAVIYRYQIDSVDYVSSNEVQDATLVRYIYTNLWNAILWSGLIYRDSIILNDLEALSDFAVIRPFVGSCESEWWVLSYWNGADVLVQFMDQGNGTVLVSALYMPRKFSPADMMTLFEFYGIHATYEKIR